MSGWSHLVVGGYKGALKFGFVMYCIWWHLNLWLVYYFIIMLVVSLLFCLVNIWGGAVDFFQYPQGKAIVVDLADKADDRPFAAIKTNCNYVLC